jgi:DNA-binding MarR family transcriptional regulator
MDTTQQRDLLDMLKTLADENRLRMVGLTGEREWTVTELADLLQLAESTVSYHISKLHGAGLLRLRMAGNNRYYGLNRKRIKTLKSYMDEIDKPVKVVEPTVSDNRWIDALDWSAADKKVLRDYTGNGKLNHIPAKEKKWLVILRWLATKFEPGVRYTEKQVNEILTDVFHDYATMRRDLVGFGFMRRERGGGDYWLTPEDETIG